MIFPKKNRYLLTKDNGTSLRYVVLVCVYLYKLVIHYSHPSEVSKDLSCNFIHALVFPKEAWLNLGLVHYYIYRAFFASANGFATQYLNYSTVLATTLIAKYHILY